jgi:L-serine deaminase
MEQGGAKITRSYEVMKAVNYKPMNYSIVPSSFRVGRNSVKLNSIEKY